jgi:hypothetical protein
VLSVFPYKGLIPGLAIALSGWLENLTNLISAGNHATGWALPQTLAQQ